MSAIAAVATPKGLAVRLSHAERHGPVIVPAESSTWAPPDEAALRRFATSLSRGQAALTTLEGVAKVSPRLGIVSETGGRDDVWRARFDDALATRINLNGHTGEFITSRNEAWVWYGFFWRLHIMVYAEGEDFNGTLLRGASIIAWGLVIADTVLAALAARRHWRVARRSKLD